MKSIIWTAQLFFLSFLLIGPSLAQAECEIQYKDQSLQVRNNDALSILMTQVPRCPQNVQEFKVLLEQVGLVTEPYLVNNRGYHSTRGSYSLFEIVVGRTPNLPADLLPGQFFFGHFVLPNSQGALDWASSAGLTIELIVWDYDKGYYNFYELITNENGTTTWFYRGDSHDALLDTELLHRVPSPPKFGNRMRCSGCHSSGGPILKEFNPPFNDWWSINRPLPIGTLRPVTARLESDLQKLGDVAIFQAAVQEGIESLEVSDGYQFVKQSLSLPEILRPLFCPVEINLESDLFANELGSSQIRVPSTHFVDPRLAKADVIMSRGLYVNALAQLSSKFPEVENLVDADHAWLTPVKSFQDRNAIRNLIRLGVLNEEFVLDVLAVDFRNPVFSVFRCELLNALPPTFSSGWVNEFLVNLSQSGLLLAPRLIENITNPARNADFHRKEALSFLNQCALQMQTEIGAFEQVLMLGQRRIELRRNQISMNPLGQILEPGFRVIFPRQNPVAHEIYYLQDENCRLRPFEF